MKRILSTFGVASLLGAALAIGGCGDNNNPAAGVTTTTAAATTTTTTAAATTTTAAGTTTTTAAATTTTAVPTTTTTTLAVTAVSVDGQGTSTTAVALSAAAGAFNYTDNIATGNNVTITDFGADDTITVTGAIATQYSFSNTAAGDVIITFNNNGVLNKFTLIAADPALALIYSATTFNNLAVGDILFQ